MKQFRLVILTINDLLLGCNLELHTLGQISTSDHGRSMFEGRQSRVMEQGFRSLVQGSICALDTLFISLFFSAVSVTSQNDEGRLLKTI